MSYNAQLLGHIAVMSYQYCQLDIKGEPSSLLDIEVTLSDGELHNIEDIAYVIIPQEPERTDQIDIYPKQQDSLRPLLRALYEKHPLVQYSLPEMHEDPDEAQATGLPPRHYITMTMPAMTKERRDATNDIVDALHQQCKLRIDKVFAKQEALTTKQYKDQDPSTMKQQLELAKQIRDEHLDMAQQLTDQTHADIEAAYQRYLAKQEAAAAENTKPAKDDTGQYLTF